VCPSCSFINVSNEKFCGGCGRLLPSDASSASGGPLAARQPDERTSLETPLEDERKHVTVLFADVKASMELLANRDPEDARKLLDPVLERMIEAVHYYGGTVNQVMGDGIMALFGAPLAHEDHAVRACYAALRMQDSVRQHAERVRAAAGAEITVRLGLHSGEVVVRSIRTGRHEDYSAVGQATHLAARMEQIAAPGTIFITADVLRLAEGYIDATAIGPVAVKGMAEPVEVFQLGGARPVRSRFSDRELIDLVGRSEELGLLGRALEPVSAGHGRVVAVVGEPGVGKSRLLWEFTRSSPTAGWLRLESSAVSYDQTSPYRPIIELLKSYFQIDSHDDHVKTREKVLGRLLTLDLPLESTLPALFSLLDVPLDHPGWQARDPAQRRRETLAALRRVLVAESRRQPLLLSIENLHWIDSETQAVLDDLVESLSMAPILLLLSYRPEYRHGWASRSYYMQLRLEALNAEATAALLRALLGDDPSLADLKSRLLAHTGGNAFFIEESIRTLLETNALVGTRGAYAMANNSTAIQLPPTVQAVIAARIDRLPLADKRILQSAAVIGANFPFYLLCAIMGRPEEAVRASLKQLRTADFVHERRLFPEVEYAFTHALTREVAYNSLLYARRRDLHARILDVIERRFGEGLAEPVDTLAHHAGMAEKWAKAATYWRQAGTKAAARSATREAVAAYEQALSSLNQLPETRDTIELGIDLRFDLHSALIPVDQLKRMVGYLRDAERLAEAIGDQRRLGRAWAHMTYCFTWLGDSNKAVQCGERALAVATATGDRELELLTEFHLGRALFGSGEYRRALECLTHTMDGLVGDHLYDRFGMPAFPAVTCRVLQGLCLALLGDFGVARQTAEEGLRLATAADHPFSLGIALWGAGLVHLQDGNADEAVLRLERAVQVGRQHNFPIIVAFAAPPLGYAYSLTGRTTEALKLLEDIVPRIESLNRAAHTANLVRLAEVYLVAGRSEDALNTVERALELTRVHDLRGGTANALRVLGDVHAVVPIGNARLAEAAYREGLALASELDMDPLAAHCHLSLGKLYQRTGEVQKAVEHLTIAMTMYREMGTRFWLERAEAELRQCKQ
jgi:class 3 adenylate cyclase/tetratricopeptide (TPR) repeat protein